MPPLHLQCFVNTERPELEHDLLETFPDSITGEDAVALWRSFEVNEANQAACAASARLWEQLLEVHRVPFLMLRVADVRFVTNSVSKVTAYLLYVEVEEVVKNKAYSAWLAQQNVAISKNARENLVQYKLGKQFTPSQKWKTNTCQDSFPSTIHSTGRSSTEELQRRWAAMQTSDSDDLSKYLNLICLETNAIEGTFQFTESAKQTLVRYGFSRRTDALKREDGDILDGAVRNCNDALLILQDTRKALDDIFELVQSDAISLTPETVKRLHRTMMSSSRVLSVYAQGHRRLVSLTIGETRRHSAVNVTIRTAARGGYLGMNIQFCPFDSVDAQLSLFCSRFNDLIRTIDVDPFAKAAWISHVFIAIHPFEDGNGRLSRMLSSIPLLLNKLPPICVDLTNKSKYHIALNECRANRFGDYSSIANVIKTSTIASIGSLDSIRDA